MRRVKFYLLAGIILFLVFFAAVWVLTEIQARHISKNMEISFSSEHLNILNNPLLLSANYFEDGGTIDEFMFSINTSIYSAGERWSANNMYSSILLLDNNKEIISRSGNFLQFIPFMVPLNTYCSEEQMAQINESLYPSTGGSGVHVQGDFYGYSGKWGFVPQKISLSSQENPQINILTLEFDNSPINDEPAQSFEKENAIFWRRSFGSEQRMLTQKDYKIIKECEEMAYDELEKRPQFDNGGGTGVTGNLSRFHYQTVSPVKINGEVCYLIIGIQAFPRRDAMAYLLPLYIILFVLMLILFFVISRSFIKVYKQQFDLAFKRQNLINSVAHEIKTPLGVIRSYCEVMQEKINENKTEHYLDVIQSEAIRMDEMISDMVSLSQLESGVELDLQKHSLSKMTEQVLARYNEAIKSKGIFAEIITLDENVINCDEKLIERVISNFLSNAVRYTEENGMIKIVISKKSDNIYFSIENSGQQISETEIDRIWDAYYKTDSARSNPKGTGLGLSIVKSLLIAHGYKFGVENTELGVKFWFVANAV